MDKLPKQDRSPRWVRVTFRVSPPLGAQVTKAYFHRDDPETDAIYKIDNPKYLTLALPPPPVAVHVVYGINGAEGVIHTFARTPMHDTKGNAWSMPLAVVPPYSVEASPATQIIVQGKNPSAELSVVVRTTGDKSNGVVHPEVRRIGRLSQKQPPSASPSPDSNRRNSRSCLTEPRNRVIRFTHFSTPIIATTTMAMTW